MTDFFRVGGWPMWPILFTGLIQLFFTWRYVQQPEPRLRVIVHSLGAVTMTVGLLGTVLGLIATLMGVAPLLPDKAYLCLIGLGESMSCIALALTFQGFTAIGRALGDLRVPLGPPGPPLNPNA